MVTSIQVLEAISWVITVTKIKIPKSKNFSTYSSPPFYKAHHREQAVTRRIFQALLEQTDTIVALIYKMATGFLEPVCLVKKLV
jgi:hypothetical protein